MGVVLGKYVRRMVSFLDKEGRRIMQECISEKTYKNRTSNLVSSYGYGVYYKGKLVKIGIAPNVTGYSSGYGKKWEGREIFGYDEIARFLEPSRGENGYKPNPESLELVIAAAMPYGEFVERKGYRVISMAYDKLKELQTKCPGSSVATIIKGNRNG